MRSLRAFFQRLFGSLHRDSRDAELSAEIETHLAMHVEDNLRAGMSPEEARRQALTKLGGAEQTKELYRDRRGLPWLKTLLRDLRFGARMLGKDPGFTGVAVLILMLGIGANAAIFSLLDALVFRDLPVSHPEELVRFGVHAPGDTYTALSLPMLEEFSRRQTAFSSTFAWWGDGVFNIEIEGELSRADVWAVTGNVYSELGALPELGRLILPDDADLRAARATQVAVLGYSFWQRRFGGDPGAVGKMIRIEGVPFTIVGVARKGFGGISAEDLPEVTVPLTAEPLIAGDTDIQKHLWRPDALFVEAAGRLKPGITLDQARAQLESLWPPIRTSVLPSNQSPAERANFLALLLKVESGAKGSSLLRRRFTQPLYLLLAIAGILLVVACVNLASLMLARAAARSQEMAVRISLGAGRGRLIQQVLAESLMLSIAGALGALCFAWWISRALSTLILGEIYIVPAALNLTPDLRILGFTAAAAVFTTVLFGLAPAWRAAREDPIIALQRGSRTASRGPGRFGKGLVVAQVALSFLLIAVAGLFVRSLEKLRAVDPGYQTREVLSLGLFPKPDGYKNLDLPRYYRQLAERVSNLPGVAATGLVHVRIGNVLEWTEQVRPTGTVAEGTQSDFEMVTPGTFRALGMSMLAGRDIGWQDDGHAPRVAVVSESFAGRLFPNHDAIGSHIDVTTEPKWQNLAIVGIVSDATLYDVRKHAPATVYLPSMQYGSYMGWSELLVQTKMPPAAIAAAVRNAVGSLGHEYVTNVSNLTREINRSLLKERVIAILSMFFGVLAMLLAAIGLYGVMAYGVAHRSREIGIRVALGAAREEVRWMVLRETLVLASLGLAAGLFCALAATRFVGSTLFGVGPNDPATLAGVSVVLFGAAALAGWLPARRATRVEPIVALRHE